VAKATAGEMVELHFDYNLRAQRMPLRGALGAPSTRPPGRLPGETRRPDQFFQLTGQIGPRLSADRRRKPNMIERALVIVETQQQGSHKRFFLQIAKTSDHAIGSPHLLDFLHSVTRAALVAHIPALGNHAVD
jgi:hypothetical protein